MVLSTIYSTKFKHKAAHAKKLGFVHACLQPHALERACISACAYTCICVFYVCAIVCVCMHACARLPMCGFMCACFRSCLGSGSVRVSTVDAIFHCLRRWLPKIYTSPGGSALPSIRPIRTLASTYACQSESMHIPLFV